MIDFILTLIASLGETSGFNRQFKIYGIAVTAVIGIGYGIIKAMRQERAEKEKKIQREVEKTTLDNMVTGSKRKSVGIAPPVTKATKRSDRADTEE